MRELGPGTIAPPLTPIGLGKRSLATRIRLLLLLNDVNCPSGLRGYAAV